MKKFDKVKVNTDVSLNKFTTYKLPAKAKYMAYPENTKQLISLIKYAREKNIKYKILGGGANLIFAHDYDGVLIKLDHFDKLEVNDTKITVGAGYNLIKLAMKTCKLGLTGLEFATGIPGTIGGAVRMNAGAHGREMKDIVRDVTCIDLDGNINIITNEECEFEYRNSLFGKNKNIVLETTLELGNGDKQEIKQLLKEYARYRIEKQPIELPNAGSTFKRGNDFITAKLIDECGLKGKSVGGAQVSTKHVAFPVLTIKLACLSQTFTLSAHKSFTPALSKSLPAESFSGFLKTLPAFGVASDG